MRVINVIQNWENQEIEMIAHDWIVGVPARRAKNK